MPKATFAQVRKMAKARHPNLDFVNPSRTQT